jgi:cell division protein FtsZ
VNLIFGAVVDPTMTDEVRITVIATGFDRAGVRPGTVERPARLEDSNVSSASGVRARPAANPSTERSGTSSYNRPRQENSHPANISSTPPAGSSAQPSQQNEFQRVMNTDDLDIPAFLRNRVNRS